MPYSAGFRGQYREIERIRRLLFKIKKRGLVIHILSDCQMACPVCSNLSGIVHLH